MTKIITKANGEKVPFELVKIESTCIRAGSSNRLAKKIARQVYHNIHDGTTTREIYKMVLELLSKNAGIVVRHRYSLKEAIMKMGPAGFSFETYVGQILEHFDYKIISIGSEVQGKCVMHEIDLILESDRDKRCLVECKYHNMPGRYTGLKESLYTHARFLDLSDKFDTEMLVCNTKVSIEAKTYAKCVGQKILSWRYPEDMSLEKMIELKKLYPITILKPTKKELESFSKNNLMVAKNLVDMTVNELADMTRIPIKRVIALQSLAKQIIS